MTRGLDLVEHSFDFGSTARPKVLSLKAARKILADRASELIDAAACEGTPLQRYWDQRRALFSRFDEGIALDRQALFSVKPEKAALKIADATPGERVLDPFCGAGGSAIAFARRGKRVVASDRDILRCAMTVHNAALYEVGARIKVIHAEADDQIDRVEADAVYFDPPWGGPDYYKKIRFSWDDFYTGFDATLNRALERFDCVSVSLPNNFDWNDLKKFDLPVQIVPGRLGRRKIFSTAVFQA